ncbi:MAG: response regulator [Candidatus Polarisedimenticolia bacterium]
MAEPIRILLVDDNPDDRVLVMRELRREFTNPAVEQIRNQSEFERFVPAGAFDVAITDFQLLWSDGLTILRALKTRFPDRPVIMFTGTGTEEVAVEAMKAGLDDYVLKRPWHFGRLPAAVRVALERRAERLALQGAERRYVELFEGAPIGIYRTAPDGAIIEVNPALLRILEYPDRADFLRRNAADLYLHQEDRSRWLREMETRGAVNGFEVQVLKRDGVPIWVRHNARRLVDATGAIFYEGVLEDVTEKKATEEALAQSEERLRQSQRIEAVGRLAGGIAHDFNNLLTVITGHAELLLSRAPAGDRTRKDLDEIRKAGERAATLTRQLLAFSRKQVLQPRVVNLNGVVQDMLKMLRRLIGEDIELATLLPADLGRTKVDPGQLEQVIMNLAVNSRDAMPRGGTLTLETGNAELDAQFARVHPPTVPGRYVVLAVTDTGVGMDKETRARVFEPFFTTKEPGKGTGLGLATVYGIVKQSGGYVWVESEPGRGTVFTIYLPRVDEAADHAAAAGPAVSGPGTETVLVLEDEPTLREVVRQSLESRGYKVLLAESGAEALAICASHPGPIHLMVADVVLPVMDGRATADRAVPLRPELRVLYMSGYTDEAILHHGVLDPGVAFLHKPFTPDALLTKVREVLGSSRPS